MKDHKLLRGRRRRRCPSTPISADALRLAPQRHGGRRPGPGFVGNFGFDLMGGGDAEADVARAGRPRRHGDRRRRRHAVPERLGDHAGRHHVDRRRVVRLPVHRVHLGDDGSLTDRRVWAQVAPTPDLGPASLEVFAQGDVRARRLHARRRRADLGGRRPRRALRPGGRGRRRSSTRSRRPAGMDFFACMLGGDDGRTLLLCCAPDFFEHTRAPAREAVLLTTRGRRPARRAAVTVTPQPSPTDDTGAGRTLVAPPRRNLCASDCSA